MSETKYITGVVIANGVPDSDDDVLTREDIKIISTKYRDRLTDVMHNRIKNEGVDVIHDWISEIDYTIDNKLVPKGSWLANFAVSNTEILKSIDEGGLNGLSLGSVSEDAMTRKNWFINKRMTYSDLKSIEEVIPLFISFVDVPANGYGFEVMDYETFISKRKKDIGEDKMTKEDVEVIDNDGAGIIKALTGFVQALGINKSEFVEAIDKEESEAEAEDKAPEAEPNLGEQILAKLDEISNQQKEILQNLNKAEEEDEDKDEDEEEAEEIDKEDETAEEESSEEETEDDAEDDGIEKSEETITEEPVETEDNIDKRQTEMPLNIDKQEAHSSFYERTGRDALGRKIR